jgi:hypothetical protein
MEETKHSTENSRLIILKRWSGGKSIRQPLKKTAKP